VVNVARGDGRSMSIQRFPMRPSSLALYGAIFHPLRYYFPRLWPRASAARTLRVEVDRRRNNYWRLGSLLHPGALSRSVSAKRLCSLTNRPRRDHRGIDLISDALLFGRLWCGEPNAIANASGHAKHHSRSHDVAFALTIRRATCLKPMSIRAISKSGEFLPA